MTSSSSNLHRTNNNNNNGMNSASSTNGQQNGNISSNTYKNSHKNNENNTSKNDDGSEHDIYGDTSEGGNNGNGELETLDEYYPRVSLKALIKLLRRSQEVKYAVKATTHICQHFSVALLDVYLEPVIEGYMDAIRRSDLEVGTTDLLFEKLAELIRMTQGGEGLRRLMSRLVKLLDDNWSKHLHNCLIVIEAVEEQLSVDEFHFHASSLLGLLLRTIKADRTRDKALTKLVLDGLYKMSVRDISENVLISSSQMRLILPDVMKVAELQSGLTHRVRITALSVLREIISRASQDDLEDFASIIVMPLLRIINVASNISCESASIVTSSSSSSTSSSSSSSSSTTSLSSSSSITDNSDMNGMSLGPSGVVGTTGGSGVGGGDGTGTKEKDLVELRLSALRTLIKVAKHLEQGFIPYIKVAHLQLSSCRQLLTYRIQAKSGGSLYVEGTEAQCYVMEEFEEMASSIWHGKLVFEVGDHVEARYKGQLNKWVPARIVKVNPFNHYDLVYTGQKVEEHATTDKSFVRKIQSIAHGQTNKHRSGSGSGGASSTVGLRQRLKSKANCVSTKQAEWGLISKEWQNGAFRRACECDKLTTAGDWTEWMRRVSVELLRNSPCPCIQPCAAIAEVYEPLAYELFNAAFISVWNAIYFDEDDKDLALEDIPIINAFENALKSQTLPNWIQTLILNLSEFMETQGAPLPIDMNLLGKVAEKSHAYAKCLHYKEISFQGMKRLEHHPSPSSSQQSQQQSQTLQRRGLEDCVEALISVNNHLSLPEAAVGILEYSKVAPKPMLLEKLGRWVKASSMYETKLKHLQQNAIVPPKRISLDEDAITGGHGGGHSSRMSVEDMSADTFGPMTEEENIEAEPYRQWRKEYIEVKLGQLRCYHALGDLEMQLTESNELVNFLSESSEMIPFLDGDWMKWGSEARSLSTSAACSLQRWDLLQEDSQLKQLLGDNTSTSGGGGGGSSTNSASSGGSASFSGSASSIARQAIAAAVAGTSNTQDSAEASVQNHMYAAMVALRDMNFTAADQCIDTARLLVAPVLSAMLDEHYSRAYSSMVTVQQLAELEEIVRFRRREDELRRLHTPILAEKYISDNTQRLKSKWRKRLHFLVAPDIDVWRRLVQVRSLVLGPTSDENTWLKLAGLCRRSGHLELCENTLKRLHVYAAAPPDLVIGPDGEMRLLASTNSQHSNSGLICAPEDELPPTSRARGLSRHSQTTDKLMHTPTARATLSLFEYMWSAGRRKEALSRLGSFTDQLLTQWDSNGHSSTSGHRVTRAIRSSIKLSSSNNTTVMVDDGLIVKCLLKMANWKRVNVLEGGLSTVGRANKQTVEALQEVLGLLDKAKNCDSKMYKAWHAWALTNHEIVKLAQQAYTASQVDPSSSSSSIKVKNNSSGDSDEELMSEDIVILHITQAISGFVKSITLGDGHSVANVLQDTLRLLTLWFSYGHDAGVHKTVEKGIKEIRVEVWLEVIPQLIARIDHHSPHISALLSSLLRRVAAAHPQALIYPMAVTSNTANDARRKAANAIIHEMSGVNRQLVDEANLVSREMMDVAITWHEFWYQGLEDAANLYFTDKDEEGMISKLAELHDHWRTQLKDAGFGDDPIITSCETSTKTMTQSSPHLNSNNTMKRNSTPSKNVKKNGENNDSFTFIAGMNVKVIKKGSSKFGKKAVVTDPNWKNNLIKVIMDGDTKTYTSDEIELVDDIDNNDENDGDGDEYSDQFTMPPLNDNDQFEEEKTSTNLPSRGAATIRVVSFIHAFGRDLKEAEEWVKLYRQSQDLAAINQAWDLYSTVFRRIKKQINNVDLLEMQHVSPKLLHARNFQLAVPGTYSHQREVIRISHFSSTVKVITSKQRPRHMVIMGSDGKSYPFLLKGHEDLRQDERVMQLFRLINALLANDPKTSKSSLGIRRYSVMPLSNNSGVIGWVPNCDTLQKLIKDYRESRNIAIDLEKRLIWGQMILEDDGNSRGDRVDYDKLDIMTKVEIFEDAMCKTQGQDLARMLWMRSPSSEVWLHRRTNFTRSLAVMCMAGYILGLGDRHPSNLMVERTSGRVVHIDFGDCFEVAMERAKYPEKVPFRLTRMLVNAMEVSGIEGNFRSTCQNVMGVLRDKSDSLNAMLEAFVHDPLIGWKLLNPDQEPEEDKSGETRQLTDATDDESKSQRTDSDAIPLAKSSKRTSSQRDVVSEANTKLNSRISLVRSKSQQFGPKEDGDDIVYTLDDDDDNNDSENKNKDDKDPTKSSSSQQPQSKDKTKGLLHESTIEVNEQALRVTSRIQMKLNGREFSTNNMTNASTSSSSSSTTNSNDKPVPVEEQVDRLIRQAQAHENLSQMFVGWCGFW